MIGEHIKKIREGKNMSINQLALYSDVSAAHISRIERGLRDPSPDILKKISEALKVPYEELMVQAGYLGWDSERPREESTGVTDLEELLKQDTLMFDGEPLGEDARAGVLYFLKLVKESASKKKKIGKMQK